MKAYSLIFYDALDEIYFQKVMCLIAKHYWENIKNLMHIKNKLSTINNVEICSRKMQQRS